MLSRDPQLRGNFARRLKALRVALAVQRGLKPNGFSQLDMANLLGITDERYRRYERGEAEASFDVLVLLRRLTGISLDVLVAGEMPGSATMIPLERHPFRNIGLGDRLRYVREVTIPDIAEVAAMMGTDLSTWLSYEQGLLEPSVDLMKQVAHRFGTSLDFLYRGQLSGMSPDLWDAIRSKHPELVPPEEPADQASGSRARHGNRKARGGDRPDPAAKVAVFRREKR